MRVTERDGKVMLSFLLSVLSAVYYIHRVVFLRHPYPIEHKSTVFKSSSGLVETLFPSRGVT